MQLDVGVPGLAVLGVVEAFSITAAIRKRVAGAAVNLQAWSAQSGGADWQACLATTCAGACSVRL